MILVLSEEEADVPERGIAAAAQHNDGAEAPVVEARAHEGGAPWHLVVQDRVLPDRAEVGKDARLIRAAVDLALAKLVPGAGKPARLIHGGPLDGGGAGRTAAVSGAHLIDAQV